MFLCDIVEKYHSDILMTYHRVVVRCFISNWFKTSWRLTNAFLLLRTLETFSRRFFIKFWRRSAETSSRRYTEVLLAVSFERHQQRCWDKLKDFETMSSQRPLTSLVVCWLLLPSTESVRQ